MSSEANQELFRRSTDEERAADNLRREILRVRSLEKTPSADGSKKVYLREQGTAELGFSERNNAARANLAPLIVAIVAVLVATGFVFWVNQLPPPPPGTLGVPWQTTASAIGTLLAVTVSVSVAVVETARTRAAKRETRALRAKQEELQRRAVASNVAGWIEDDYVPDATGSSYVRRVHAFLLNSSSQPVFDVNASIGVGFPFRPIGPLSIPRPIATLPPGRELVWDISIPLLAHENTHVFAPSVELGFTDPNGARWTRGFDGTLRETTGELAQILDSDADEEDVLRQVGRFDPHNPMAVAITFVNALLADPIDRDLLEAVLAPEAPAWANTTDEDLASIAQELHQFGIATYAHYPAPHVAYVKIVAQEYERTQIVAGESATVETKFIMLTYVRKRGWRVFSYAPSPTAPDRILFPEGELLGDEHVSHYSTREDDPET